MGVPKTRMSTSTPWKVATRRRQTRTGPGGSGGWVLVGEEDVIEASQLDHPDDLG